MRLDAIQDQLCEIAPLHNIRSPVSCMSKKCLFLKNVIFLHSISVNLKNSQSLTDLPKSVEQMTDTNLKAVPAAASQISNNGMCAFVILSTSNSIQISFQACIYVITIDYIIVCLTK